MSKGQEPLPFAARDNRPQQAVDRDRRADGNRRTIHFDRERIIIMRRIQGMSMRVTMPVDRYDGVGVLLPNPAEGSFGFRVVLVHGDPDLCVRLFEDSDPLMIDAAIAEWSQFFGLPVIGGSQAAVVGESGRRPQADNGAQTCAPANFGALVTGSAWRMRRRGGTLAKRRPRLYARRRVGDETRMQAVFRNEREIIARD